LPGTRRSGSVKLARELGTRLGPFGGINLQTMSIAKAHLDDLVRQGSAAPLWTTKGNS
jgi:hypothetical protein